MNKKQQPFSAFGLALATIATSAASILLLALMVGCSSPSNEIKGSFDLEEYSESVQTRELEDAEEIRRNEQAKALSPVVESVANSLSN